MFQEQRVDLKGFTAPLVFPSVLEVEMTSSTPPDSAVMGAITSSSFVCLGVRVSPPGQVPVPFLVHGSCEVCLHLPHFYPFTLSPLTHYH